MTTFGGHTIPPLFGGGGGGGFGEVTSGMDVVDAIADTPTNGENPVEPVIINSAKVVPEPGTIGLLGLGSLVFIRRWRKA